MWCAGRESGQGSAWSKGVGGNPLQNIPDMDGSMGSLPGDFLVGPDGRLEIAYYGRDAGDFLLFSEIDRFLDGAPTRWQGVRSMPPQAPG